MVVSNQHTHRSSASTPGQQNKPRRRSSLNKQYEKESPASINASQHHSNSTNNRHHHLRIASSGSPHSSYERSRQSSAHIIHSNHNNASNSTLSPTPQPVPRLSIADRFMYSNSSGASNAALSPSPATAPAMVSNSVQPEQSIDENGRLSVADRFMNSSSSSLTPLNTSNYQKERSPSNFSGKTLASRNPSMLPTPSTDSPTERLTIASAFMKGTTDGGFSSPTSYGRSREASVGDLDMGVGNKSTYSKTLYSNSDQVHPLQAPTDQQSQAGLFDSDYLNLDLSLSSSAASSVINSSRNLRPWGSQDTLVQTDKKRPIYAQFIETEKNAMIPSGLSSHDYSDTYSQPLSLSDYYDEKRDTTITMSDDMSTKHEEEEGYDYYDDAKPGYEKYENYNAPSSVEKWKVDVMDDEKHKKRNMERHDSLRHDYRDTTQGFWVGCCFVSCGHRHSSRDIEKKEKQQKRDRKEKDVELDARPKNRGCGRRGWVFCTFISLILFILITYFIWPRTPLMRIEGASLTTPAKITQTRQGVMIGNVAFESQWMVNVTVDNRQNHVPTRIVQVQLLAKDALTGLVIGKGLHNDDPNQEHIVLAANSISTIQLPVYVDYQARDSTDTTFVDLTKACAPQNSIVYNSPDGGVATNQHEALPLHFWITLHFFGLDWLSYKPTVIATPATGGFACPQS